MGVFQPGSGSYGFAREIDLKRADNSITYRHLLFLLVMCYFQIKLSARFYGSVANHNVLLEQDATIDQIKDATRFQRWASQVIGWS